MVEPVAGDLGVAVAEFGALSFALYWVDVPGLGPGLGSKVLSAI
jgi:hypothetical protein